MTLGETIKLLFAVAFIVMAAVALGGLLVGDSPDRDYRAGAALLVFVGVGAGLWLISDWRKR